MFIIEISYNVLYVWHCMELYDKKFFINGNCMIRSFGQPGWFFVFNPSNSNFLEAEVSYGVVSALQGHYILSSRSLQGHYIQTNV